MLKHQKSNLFPTDRTKGDGSRGHLGIEPGGSAGTQLAEAPLPEEEGTEAAGGRNPLWYVVLAGGIGSRFWPLSSAKRPKQLLPLVDDRPLIAGTISRILPLVPPERIVVMTSSDIAAAIHSAIPMIPAENMLAEPRPMGTAASVAWAMAEIRRRSSRNSIACVTHADLAISFEMLFHDAVERATALSAQVDGIVLMGVAPTRVETSFGYITAPLPLDGGVTQQQRGGAAGSTTAAKGWPSGTAPRRVASYAEKPDHALAAALQSYGAFWNAGLFVGRVGVIEGEIRNHLPKVAPVLNVSSAAALTELAPTIPSVSIERGVFERSSSLVVIPVDFSWDDVGTWNSLKRARELDDSGNGAVGAAHLVNCAANIVHAEAGDCVLFGVDNLLVVRRDGLLFVTTLERARDLRALTEKLPDAIRRWGAD